MGQPGFFDLNERYQSLSNCGDPLEVPAREIPWESFRPALKKALKKPRKSNAGRKAFDCVLMFKALVLQSLYNLADAQMEFMVRATSGDRHDEPDVQHVPLYPAVAPKNGISNENCGHKPGIAQQNRIVAR